MIHLSYTSFDFTIIHELFGVVSIASLRTKSRLFKDAVLSIMLNSPLLLFWFAQERGFYYLKADEA